MIFPKYGGGHFLYVDPNRKSFLFSKYLFHLSYFIAAPSLFPLQELYLTELDQQVSLSCWRMPIAFVPGHCSTYIDKLHIQNKYIRVTLKILLNNFRFYSFPRIYVIENT